MKKIYLSIFGIMAAFTLQNVAFAKSEIVPYEKFYPYLKDYYKLPAVERSLFRLGYFADYKEKTHFRAYIVRGQEKQEISRNEFGEFTPVVSAEDTKSGANILIDWPDHRHKKELDLELRFVSQLMHKTNYKSSEIANSASQAYKSAKKAAGAAGFAIPKLNGVCFFGSSSGVRSDSKGNSVALDVAKGTKHKAFKDVPCYKADLNTEETITLDRVPKLIVIVPTK